MRITHFEEGQGLPWSAVSLVFVLSTYGEYIPSRGSIEAVFTHKLCTRLVTKARIHVDVV